MLNQIIAYLRKRRQWLIHALWFETNVFFQAIGGQHYTTKQAMQNML
jgi:hypothetical protein